MSRLGRLLVVGLAVAVIAATWVFLVRLSNGDFSGRYQLTGYFHGAGQGLHPGSSVVYRGVQVGQVSSTTLAGTTAKVVMLIDPTFKVPASSTATIGPINLFGADEVSLTSPPGSRRGPFLAPGATIARTANSDELGDLFAAASPLLRQVNTQDLSTVVSELAQASAGEGPQIAASFSEGAKLAALLDETLQAQLAALDSFARFAGALVPTTGPLNSLSAQENVALPAFNADAADYAKLLAALTPFADHLSALLSDYHPDISTLIADGANVARVFTAQRADVGQLIVGLYEYVYKLGHAVSPATLPDGSRFGYFNTFILFSDINQLVCSLIAPAAPNLAYLEPLQQALAGAGTPFNCSSQMAAFDAAQASAPTPSSPLPPSASNAAAQQALQQIENQVAALLGQPSTPSSQTIDQYLQTLLGGGG
jgi:phospholipid/cholesterol/gamma-HCH transport system substrate-binding protein